MDNELLIKVLEVAITILGLVLTYYVVPFIKSKTTEKQREDAEYWIKMAIKFAEMAYKDKGQGKFKKEYVINFLNKKGIKLTLPQLNNVIDLFVDEFNKNDWK